jgi:predicted HTH transcriptional regulator
LLLRQQLALVYLQQHEFITNADYRRLNRVDAMVAGQELRGLVQAGLIDQQGASRGTSYTLQLPRESPDQKAQLAEEAKILAYVREHGTINNIECRTLLSVDLHRASYLLKKLAGEGALKQEGERRWTYYRLP